MDLRWFAELGTLHVVDKQMVADTVMVKYLGDVFSVDDERP